MTTRLTDAELAKAVADAGKRPSVKFSKAKPKGKPGKQGDKKQQKAAKTSTKKTAEVNKSPVVRLDEPASKPSSPKAAAPKSSKPSKYSQPSLPGMSKAKVGEYSKK